MFYANAVSSDQAACLIPEKPSSARISADNGATFVTPAEALRVLTWEAVVPYLDDEIRERVNAELAPCTESEFLTRYLELAPADLVIG